MNRWRFPALVVTLTALGAGALVAGPVGAAPAPGPCTELPQAGPADLANAFATIKADLLGDGTADDTVAITRADDDAILVGVIGDRVATERLDGYAGAFVNGALDVDRAIDGGTQEVLVYKVRPNVEEEITVWGLEGCRWIRASFASSDGGAEATFTSPLSGPARASFQCTGTEEGPGLLISKGARTANGWVMTSQLYLWGRLDLSAIDAPVTRTVPDTDIERVAPRGFRCNWASSPEEPATPPKGDDGAKPGTPTPGTAKPGKAERPTPVTARPRFTG